MTPLPFSTTILASTPEEQMPSSMTTPGFPFSSSAFVEKTVKSAMASTFGLPSGFWNLLEFRDPFGSMMMRVARSEERRVGKEGRSRSTSQYGIARIGMGQG